MSILKAEAIAKRFDYPEQVEVLRNISLTLEPGETLAIMGASGEGKSTLLQILGTLERPTAGRLSIVDKVVSPGHEARIRNQHIGFIFQNFFLMEDYTAFENVLMPVRIGRLPVSPRSDGYLRGRELMELVGLSERRNYPAKLLSGGEKQRVAIARALVNDPDLLLADEPSGNLDHRNSEAVHSLLLELVRGRGKGLITVTHDRELAALCDRSLTLHDGRLSPTQIAT